MDSLIEKENEKPPSSPNDADDENNQQGFQTLPLPLSSSLDFRVSAQAAMKEMDVRRYLSNVVSSQDLTPILNNQSISRVIVRSQNVSLLRLAITNNAEVLDFRALDYWLPRLENPTYSFQRIIKSPANDNDENPSISEWDPPDEFDWFSWDRMGKIVTMEEACELFSILETSPCTPNLKELMINATRPTYWSSPPEKMPVIAQTLLQMKLVTKLILRGLADDYILKLVGKTAFGLKYLDVSCSIFVTDLGVQNLFFNVSLDKKNSSSVMFLIPSWVTKNWSKMSPLVNTLLYLDLSWTNVTSLSRKMINAMPGSYMFKRLLAQNENESYGHHLFVRKIPELSTTIRWNDPEDQFEAELQPFAGKDGTTHFLKFIETHAWRNCNLVIFPKPTTLNKNGNPGEDDKTEFVAFVTPSKEEKRIQGFTRFSNGNLVEIYSIFPTNLNQLALACPKLQRFRGSVADHWRQKGQLLSRLTRVDVFCEPISALSIITACQNLKSLRIRIVKKVLSDQPLLLAFANSISTRTLEELWIAPGSFKKPAGFKPETIPEPSSSGLANISIPSGVTAPSSMSSCTSSDSATTTTNNNEYQGSMCQETCGPNSGTKSFQEGIEGDNANETAQKDPRLVEDLIQLSISCARKIIGDCQRLRRLGNLSSWWITDNQLQALCQEIVSTTSGLNVLWDNLVLPSGCTFQEGSI